MAAAPRVNDMAHPQMFDDDDPVLAEVRRVTLHLPGTAEKVSHGRPAFYTKKIFAYYGGAVRRDDGEWFQHPHAIMTLPDAGERLALLEDPRCFVPAYLGPYGWLGLDLDAGTDWSEVSELVDASYRNTAPTRLVAELDAAQS